MVDILVSLPSFWIKLNICLDLLWQYIFLNFLSEKYSKIACKFCFIYEKLHPLKK